VRPAEGTTLAATAAIQTEDLTKSYGRLVAVDHLSFEVQSREILGFLGPNGAGKTTTMRMLLGLVQPSSGSARILGMDIEQNLPQILSRTGSIIENPTFYPFLSGRDNLRVVAKLTGSGNQRIEAVLELADLTGSANRSFKTYSLGMKQRLAVAAALLGEPDLLILDEPGNGLDPAGIVEMRDLMRRLKAQGNAVLISSHVLHEIEQICDRIIILNHGKIVVQGKVDSLLNARSRIAVRIDRAGEAQALLKRVEWIEDVSRDGDLLLLTAPQERAAEINKLLADEALYAGEIRPEEESLERFFLDVTEDVRA
jgi:ABC-2 type transport system ATP-binding protein